MFTLNRRPELMHDSEFLRRQNKGVGVWTLTKKRRLNKNRKYLVAAMHPFPMTAAL